ncbi:MAG TPA: XamI family restriction endonuclease [Anaerolineae bacterium]|nr:XamI family restriction endonuclease [Anaerolineae bacterium]
MPISADKPLQWKADVAASVDLYNDWFMRFGPKAYRDTRAKTTERVQKAIQLTDELTVLGPEILKAHPSILPVLRMSTAPPLARDRLAGLAYVSRHLIQSMEDDGQLPPRMREEELASQLQSIARVLIRLLDQDLFPWLEQKTFPTKIERYRASTVVADRLCGAISDPIIRNAQEQRQLNLIARYLRKRGYAQVSGGTAKVFTGLPMGTFAFRMNVTAGVERTVNVPVDVVIQPHQPHPSGFPILIEAKSAGDFANTNKRRKEEATKVKQLRGRYGDSLPYLLFLCGYFDAGYLGYEAAEGIDWVWEHRIEDLELAGV